MAKVFLRVYNREIESMIEGGQLDEAVAHCQYILKTFPMHVDTYRLLGKAFLEARRYADAADIFQRVLMAVPDDFVSHVGMSIIRDDENKMDDAIWHMERAFEVQPSNSAIQGELRRLYGKRDGVEPSKIRLSRDALANMYSQGELFNQAIAEIRSVLAEDTNRPDLQVMLARAYYRSGQKVEAAEMAAALLKKYPYCMDSLRVLVDVLPGTARAENTQVYRQRLHNLDPYSSFTVNSVFASDQVADSTVNLERLDYKSGSTPVTSQPDWASSLGIKLNDEKQADNPPAWMQSADTTEQVTPSSPESSGPSGVPAVAAVVDSVPDWMRSAGWQESNKSEQVGSTDSGESVPDEPIARAEIPDWLKSMAPTEAAEEATSEPDEPAESLPVGEDGIPQWLKPTGSLAAVGSTLPEVRPPAEPPSEIADNAPDWLKSMPPAESAGEVEPPEAQQPVVPLQTNAETPLQSAAEVPDWLKSLTPAEAMSEDQIEAPAQPVEAQQTSAGPQPASADEVPDWLASMSASETLDEVHAEPPVQPIESQPAPIEPQPASADEVPEWLNSMSASEAVDGVPAEAPLQPVEPQPAPAGPQPASAEVPDWLKSMAETEAAEEIHAEAPAQPVEPQQTPAEPQPASSEDFPEWFNSLAPSEAAGQVPQEPEQPVAAQPAPVESQPAGETEIPDWLKSLAPADTAAEVQAVTQPPAEPQQEPVESHPGTADDVLDWLKSMDSTESVEEPPSMAPQKLVEPEQAPVEPSPASQGGVPDWFKTLTPAQPDMSEILSEPPQIPVEPQTVGLDATPDWLRPLAPADSDGEVPAEAPQQPIAPRGESEEGIPDWLKSMAPAETAAGSQAVPEPESAEPSSPRAEPGSIPEETPPEIKEAFPNWLSGMGTRADAAALTAKAMEQPVVSEPSVPEVPAPPEPSAQAQVKPPISPASTTGESFQPTGEVKPLNIGDDAFSWLESLAAKQGAKPEELLTTPEERSGEMPDWLRQPDEKPAEASVAPAGEEPKRNPPETLPLEPLSWTNAAPASKPAQPVEEVLPVQDEISSTEPPLETAAQAEVQPVSGEDDTMAWLETLGADQEIKPEEPLVSPAAEKEAASGWVQNVESEQPAVPAQEEVLPVTPEPVPADDDVTITSWLSKLDVDEALGKKNSEIPAEAVPATPADELPDWLKDLEKPAAPVEAPKADNDLPEWLRHPIPSEPTAPATAEPVSDAAPESALPAWMDENISTTGQAAPTMPEEWLPADTKAEGIPDFLSPSEPSPILGTTPQTFSADAGTVPDMGAAPVSEPVPSDEVLPVVETPRVEETIQPAESIPVSVPKTVRMPTLKQTGMLSHIPVLDKDAELLLSAQNVLDQDSLDDAMKKYTKLIKKGRLLDEVIHDLREAIYRYPVDVIVWQTLGDSYMRANRLQDALDAYTKAEELLR